VRPIPGYFLKDRFIGGEKKIIIMIEIQTAIPIQTQALPECLTNIEFDSQCHLAVVLRTIMITS